jgi:glycosyltransferase involved in cell wall biosynthesis
LAGAPRDTAATSHYDGQRPVKIGFLGTLFKPPRVPGELMHEALRDINKSGSRAELHVHGNVPRTATKAWIKRLREDGLIFHGRSSHRDSVRELLQYDYLLLLLADLPNSKVVMSIKLPHYLLIGIPIIAVVPQPSAVADIIRETGAGYVVPINADWQSKFIEIIRTPASHLSLPRNEKAIHAYSWDELSTRWIQALSARRAH